MKVSILTLGCKVNQAESTFIERSLLDLGCSIVSLSENPEYCIINTCSVTAKSDYQSRQLVRRAVRTGAKVIATGCYSELRPDEIHSISDNVDIVGNEDKCHIIQMLPLKSKRVFSCFFGRSRPYLKIQDGCNAACSYCIVPKARGRSRSVGVPEILEQVLKFESSGYHEIVLTGIHLGSYGKDMNPKLTLSDIAKTILNKTTIDRIRLSSIELNEIDEDLLDLLKERRVCRHVHLPLQSGDDGILRKMNRFYTSRDYERVVESISRSVSDVSIGTDVIVGFPGEGKKEFLNTKNLLASLPLSYLHIFPFSPRPGTAALIMSDQVSIGIKKDRCNELAILNNVKRSSYMSSQLNKTVDVIIEEKCDDQTTIGTTGNYLKVRVHSKDHPVKSLVHVRAATIEDNRINGFPIEEP